jgi:uncharacterized protein YkwD
MLIIILLLNLYRIQNNIPPVQVNQSVCRFAEQRLVEIQTDWNHDKFIKRKKDIRGYGWWHENLAKNFNDPKDVLNTWKESPKHNKILLSNFKFVCLKESNGYWVLEGWKPLK